MDCPACGCPIALEVGPDRRFRRRFPTQSLQRRRTSESRLPEIVGTVGGHETRRIRIESIDTTAGDEAAIERAVLIDEIIDELEGIDQVATLEDLLAETRRQRRTDATTADTDGDVTE